MSRNPLILPLYLPSLIFAFCQGLLAPILPLYAADFDVSYGLVGLVLAGDGIGTLLADVPAGVFLRRLGKKRAMLLGVGCAALSTVALFGARSIAEALLYRLLTGFAVALFNLARHAYLADTVIPSSRGRSIALFGGINRVGRFAGPAIGGMVAAGYGLRAPFLVVGSACAVAFAVVAVFCPTTTEVSPRDSTPSGSHLNHLLSNLKAQRRVLATAGVGQLFGQMVRAGRAVIIPLYAADVIGLDVQAIGLIVSISAAVDMSLFYPAGLIMDRWGRKFAIVPCFLLQAIGMSLVPLTMSLAGLLMAAMLIGLGNGLGSGTMMTLGADLAPQNWRGEFLGVWRLVGDVGATGGPLVAGSVAGLLVLPAAAWAMAGAGLMAVAIFVLFVPETLRE
jgi:MFS family permease